MRKMRKNKRARFDLGCHPVNCHGWYHTIVPSESLWGAPLSAQYENVLIEQSSFLTRLVAVAPSVQNRLDLAVATFHAVGSDTCLSCRCYL